MLVRLRPHKVRQEVLLEDLQVVVDMLDGLAPRRRALVPHERVPLALEVHRHPRAVGAPGPRRARHGGQLVLVERLEPRADAVLLLDQPRGDGAVLQVPHGRQDVLEVLYGFVSVCVVAVHGFVVLDGGVLAEHLSIC